MPSLRKRVSSYFRQLSFHNEPREKRHNINENSFITKYLQGDIKLHEGPPIVHGKNPIELPNYDLCSYRTGSESIVGCYTGPSGGCTTIQRQEKHLSMAESEIEFIDNPDEDCDIDQRSNMSTTTTDSNQHQSPAKLTSLNSTPNHGRNSATLDITSMQIRVAGQTYLVTSNKKQKADEKLQKSLSQNSLAKLSNVNTEQPLKSSDLQANQGEINIFATLPRLVVSKQQIQENILTKDVKDGNGNGTLASVVAFGDLTSIQGFDDKGKVGSGVLKSKSEGNPFRHTIVGDRKEEKPKKRKEGKIIRIANRPTADNDTLIHMISPTTDTISSSGNAAPLATSGAVSAKLPPHWRRSTEYAFGVAHSLYDKNPITGKQNGDPIADCFGLISRRDSAVLAVADGVNWGEKACVAAKSAIHASLHYLNTTLFHDSTLFTPNPPSPLLATASLSSGTIHQTKDVFIALLRAFHCAHDLILERGGMLTTLTVAVVLPVKGRSVVSSAASDGDSDDDCDDAADARRKMSANVRVGSLGENWRGQGEVEGRQQRYVCCVCNVGDTLAYVYSQRDGIRELTKGSHDINCNRDMRDALGALGPVDGHNPELSNLTLSITTVQRGDIILVASDGLTDNFDPNVCKFTVSANSSSVATNTSNANSVKKKQQDNVANENRKTVTGAQQTKESPAVVLQVPVKPPRKTKNYIALNRESVSSRSSAERASVASVASSSQRSGSKTSLSMSEEVSSHPLIAQFLTDNAAVQGKRRPQDTVASSKEKAQVKTTTTTKPAVQKSISMKNVPIQGKKTTQNPSVSSSMVTGFSFLRSKTLIDFRPQTAGIVAPTSQIARNNDGVPYVTPLQRYELTLLLMEDILKRGITGRETQCVTARKLCQELYNFTISLTNAKRKTLEEDSDLYYNQQQQQINANTAAASQSGGGVLVELGAMERKARRKRALERVQALPGKLDHVTVVACNVGMW